MMYGYGAGPQDWLFMLAMMIVMMVLTVVAVVAIVRAVRAGNGPTDARQALDQRSARGEVSTEEYRERTEHLSQR
jgi:putative membrane protein